MKHFLLCALTIAAIATSSTGFSSSLFHFKLKLEQHSYATMEEAAIEAEHQAYELAPRFEAGGMIYQNNADHTFTFTEPFTNHSPDQLVTPHAVRYDGYTMVADYHTHPCYPDFYTELFSPDDIRSNISWDITGFILDGCRGYVHRFRPGIDAPDAVVITKEDGTKYNLTPGIIVGYVDTGHYEPSDIKHDIPIPTDLSFGVLISTPYDSINEAAVEGLKQAEDSQYGTQFEYGGLIYQSTIDQKYYITQPTTSNDPGQVVLPFESKFPDMKLVGSYHSHMCNPHYISYVFSKNDIVFNEVLHIVGYMVDECTGDVHRFDPSNDRDDDVTIVGRKGSITKLTAGHIVGWINKADQ